ncbi:MAG: hypothetical protein RLY97_22 [Pseudomonadota bacterium]
MKRGRRAIERWTSAIARGRGAWLFLICMACVFSITSEPVFAKKSSVIKVDAQLKDQILSTMRVLASDEFMGREPGTEGEAKTLRYLARQWFDLGLTSGTNDPGHAWFAPVTLVAREPAVSTAQFMRKGRLFPTAASDVLVLTSGRRSLVEGAPLLFVGHGTGKLPSRSELAGRIAVMLDKLPDAAVGNASGTAKPDNGVDSQNSKRQNALLAGGASAVLTILDGGRNLDSVSARRRRSGYALAGDSLGGDLEGFITPAAMDHLLANGGNGAGALSNVAALALDADRVEFVPHVLDLAANMEATTRETTIRTHNIIGKLPGRHPEAGAVLLLAHWDHFGSCAQPPAAHLICNGAIDNASGVAALTEIARRLAKGPQLDRDVYFLGTTAEELGLLGAEAFAENPPLPLKNIVAALNLDSVAIAPAGTPVAIVGKGMTGLETAIAAVAKEQKRNLSDSTAPNAYIKRQDGWALLRHDVPALMVSSAYGEIARLEAFFDKDYHRPSDVVKAEIELGGAAEDVVFHVALVRYLADLRRFPIVGQAK